MCRVAPPEACHFAFLVRYGAVVPPLTDGHGAGLTLTDGGCELVSVCWTKQSPAQECFGIQLTEPPACDMFAPTFWRFSVSPWTYWHKHMKQ